MELNLKSKIIHHTSVVTRYAPSPTGLFHIGAVRTVLFNYCFAKKNGGTMILRIEDTDKERSKKEYERDIIDGLLWLGIGYDGPHRQSERTEVYKKHLETLLKEDKVYESPEAEGTVFRFRNPGKTVRFHDAIRGDIESDTKDLGDFVIARSLISPLFHFAVVVDDDEMNVSHVIRGEDHISNTPRQILIQEALGIARPVYAHLPLVLAPDKSKLSKRNLTGGMIAVRDYKNAGYLPEAILNFTALLGWSPEDGREIFSLDELVSLFSLDRIQKSGAQFNIQKLRWCNKEHMKNMSDDDFLKTLVARIPTSLASLPHYSEERLARAAVTIRERIEVFADVEDLAQAGELDYFFVPPRYENPQRISSAKDDGQGAVSTREHIQYIIDTLSSLTEDTWSEETVKNALWDYATENGRGNVLWPMRFALSGREKSPDPFTLAKILGKEETVARLHAARNALGTLS